MPVSQPVLQRIQRFFRKLAQLRQRLFLRRQLTMRAHQDGAGFIDKQTVSLAVEQRSVKNGTIYVDQILRNQNPDRLAGIVFDQHAVTADPFFSLIQLRIRQTAAFRQRLLKKRILTYLFFQMVVAADIDQIRIAAQICIPHPNELILIINGFQNVDHPVGVVNPCFADNDRQRFQGLKITVDLLDQRVLQLRRGIVQILNTVLLALGAHIMNIAQTAQ